MQSPLTQATADRIESALTLAAESRVAHIAALEGNPLSIEMRAWSSVRATPVRRSVFYYPVFNAIRNVASGCEDELDEALSWFKSEGVACDVCLSPFRADQRLLAHLADRGLRIERFMSVLFAEAPFTTTPGPDMQVFEDKDGFVQVWLVGSPAGESTVLEPLVRAEFAEWRCYVTRVAIEPVAMAGLHIQDRVAVMASASTLPQHHGRGYQAALLQRRIKDAAAAGCELVVSQAAPNFQSQRNMERAGLRTA